MIIISQCLLCKHFIKNGAWGCKAFDIIPDEIFFNKKQHNNKLDSQSGEYIYTPITTDNKIK